MSRVRSTRYSPWLRLKDALEPGSAGAPAEMERQKTQSGPTTSTDTLSAAEELLVEFLARRGEPDECTFHALCTAHPAHARELERLYTEWSALDRVLGARRAGQAPLEQRLQASAPGATTAADPAALDPLLARLSSRNSGEPRYRVDEELARGGMGVVYKV
jgi:hypothetical protein